MEIGPSGTSGLIAQHLAVTDSRRVFDSVEIQLQKMAEWTAPGSLSRIKLAGRPDDNRRVKIMFCKRPN